MVNFDEQSKVEGITIKSGLRAGEKMGFGDQCAQFFHNVGVDKYAQVYSEVTGKDCGCEKRRQILNQLFPG
jgi:hypothetical protein